MAPPASLPASTSRGNTPATAAATNTDNSHETASPPDAAKPPGDPGALAPGAYTRSRWSSTSATPGRIHELSWVLGGQKSSS